MSTERRERRDPRYPPPPSTKEVLAQLDEIIQAAKALKERYPWAFNLSYAGGGQGGVKVKASASQPTESIATSMGGMRNRQHTSDAGNKAADALASLKGAHTALDKVVPGPASGSTEIGAHYKGHKGIRDPDYQHALEMQAKRELRGESWGEA